MSANVVPAPAGDKAFIPESAAAASQNDASAGTDNASDEDILRDIASVCGVDAAVIEDLYPCTPLQVGIIAQPIERIYINCIYATLAASLDLERFCDAMHRVYTLNPVLRTRIVDSELGLVQVVLKVELSISRPPVRGQDNEQQVLQATLQREKSTPMRMGQPLFRASVVGRTVVLTTHHAIADGGTYHSLFDNLSRAYHGEALAPHAEFRLFVRYCYSIEPAAASAFWGPRFSGHPVAFPIMDIDVMPDARITIKTVVSLASMLHDVPVGLMSSYVETAWAVTAMSYMAAESVLFGRVLSARGASLGGLESTLGPTIVTMPVQVNLSQTATIGSLIRERAQERREALSSSALQYGLVGLRTVNEAAKRAARFTTLINFRTPTDQGTDYVSTKLDIHGEYEPHLPYALGISLVWNGKGLAMDTLYDPDIVCERQTRRILRQFEHILGLLLQMPAGTRLGELTLLNAHDRREMIAWNRLSTDPVGAAIPHLFWARARAQPDDPAVQGPEGDLTYATLDRKSDAVAHGLRSRGIGKEDAVGLIFNKSIWAVIAQLGVLKTDAVCVPIDPSFPSARKKAIIAEARAAMILTHAPLHELSPDWSGSVWILEDGTINLADVAAGSHDGDDGVASSQAAFILFTSGSTGTPKGHTLEHRNLVSSLTAIGRDMGFGPDTRMLQFAAYVWDMSIAETYGTLLAGGCVCVPSDEARESSIAEYITAAKVNTAIFTPTVLRLLAPHEAPLKTIMSIGEPVDLESADIWTAAGCRFFNAWGPSETACVSTMAELTPMSAYCGNIGRPLASATWLVDARDSDAGRLVPVGAVGEILVEGQGVSRGYINAPQQTARAFIDPPRWAPSRRGAVGRMYRTGDLAKYNPDGSLQYVGRMDNQVKVSGQRVELGEVEKALSSCEDVRHVVCVTQALKGHGSRKSLVAVVVLNRPLLQNPRALKELSAEHEASVSRTLDTLRQLLSSRLPSYMIPSVWKVVEDFPRTTSLKIDRSSIKKWLVTQLASSDGSGTEAADADTLTEPVSPAEFCLRAAWAAVLGLHKTEVGRESTFIKLGGDSILAIKVATLCRKQGLRVSVATLLKSPSLAEVAENSLPIETSPRYVNGSSNSNEHSSNGVDGTNDMNGSNGTRGPPTSEPYKSSPAVQWDPARMPMMQSLLEDLGLHISEVEEVLPCSPLQQDVTLSQVKDDGSDYWMKLRLRLTSTINNEAVDQARLVQSWKAVCASQPILRTVIANCESGDNVLQQIILKDPSTSISSVKLGATEESTDIESVLDAVQPPDLIARKPQHHLHLLASGAGTVYAVVFINHALFDERSVRLLADQLNRAYGDAASLPKGRSLATYLERIEESKAATRKYWKRYLSGAEPCNVPELTKAESKLTSPDSDMCNVPISDVRRLTDFCREHNYTLASLMQVAWAIVLRICTGCQSPTFGYLYSHSGWVEDGDTTLGPLLAMAYLRLKAGADTSIDQILKIAHEESTQALDCGACSVSQLYEDLGMGSSPLFNTIMTIYRLVPQQTMAVQAGGLNIQHLPLTGHNEYLMTVGVAYNNDAIHSKILFDPAKAVHSFVSHVAELLSTVINRIVRDSGQSLGSLETALGEDLILFSPQDISRAIRHKAAAHCEVQPAQIEYIYPCTPIQCQQLEAAMASSHSDLDQYIFDFDSCLSLATAHEAWESVVAATPILRSRIVSLGDYGTCLVTLASNTHVIAESLESWDEYLRFDCEKPVRYGRPLCRLGICETADGAVSALLSLHRAIYDPWAITLIERALSRACAGEIVRSNPSHRRCTDHRTCRRATEAAKSRRSESSVLSALEAPRFPRLQALGGVVKLSGSRSTLIDRTFDPETLHAAWALTLARVTGNTKVTFYSHVDGRRDDMATAELLEVTGPVGAMHTFSADMSSTPSVASLLSSVRRWNADASSKSSLTSDTRSHCLSTSAAANILMIDQSPRLVFPDQDKRAVTRRRGGRMSDTAPVEGVLLVLRCATMADKVIVDSQYDENTMSTNDVSTLIAQYHHTLQQLSSADAETLLADLPALSNHELSLLRQWALELPSSQDDGCIHDSIRQYGKTNPTAPAVCSWDCDLNHGELDDLSDRLAAYLIERGVEARTVVPYFLEKSAVAVVIMLGILKTGGTLLPLDSNHPGERLKDIIAESDASIVLTVSALLSKVRRRLSTNNNNSSSGGGNQELLEVNMDMVRSLRRETHKPTTIGPSDLCYIMYTSGSSGKPKGVMVTHANLSASASARRELVGMNHSTRTLQYLNFIFDVSMFDVFLTLLAGGCVCLPSEDEWSSNMAGAIRRTRANFVFLTPSLATLLNPADVPTLDTLGLTGEPCEAHIVEKWKHLRVLNMYGPAEATVHSSGADVSFRGGKHHLNMGRAGGCTYWAVDPEQIDRLVPIGCPGELLIHGAIVAKGYLGDPGRTTAAFINPPSWAETMGIPVESPHRWYKTGDLVIQTSDGSMVYQGRKDTQVKVSGQRVELGEIEHQLLRSSSKTAWHVAVELVQPAGHEQDKSLVVFFAARAAPGEQDGDQDEQNKMLQVLPSDDVVAFREALAARLPPYMVPRYFVRLAKLPMTHSGKTDRAALRRLGGSLSPAELGRYSASRPANGSVIMTTSAQATRLETELTQLWAEVLRTPRETIRPQDNFFSLGGSSIRATRLSHSARRAGIELKVALVFECPTLSQMAAAASWSSDRNGSINGSSDATDPDPATRARRLTKLLLADADFCESCEAHAGRRARMTLAPAEIDSVAPATDVQADMVAVSELDRQAWHNRMTIESTKGLDVARLQRACAAVARHHDLFRTTFVQHRSVLYQVAMRRPAEIECGSHGEGHEGGENDLPRFLLHELSADGQRCHKLVLAIHHAHYDAIAMDIVLQDLRAAYESTSDGNEDTGQATSPRFHDLVAHTAALDTTEARRFWTAALRGSKMTGLVRASAPATAHPCVDSVRVRVPMACVEAGSSLGTPSSVVQAAWALLLARATGRDDVVFCAPHANRDVPGFADADRVAGLCLNFLPTRARLGLGPGGAATLGALIRQMQAGAVAAIPHRHLGFRTIVRECTAWPAWTRYRSMLIYQNHDSLRRHIRFGDLDCVLTAYGNFGRTADVLVEATPTSDGKGGQDELVIDLLLSRRSFTNDQVDWIAQSLESILRAVPTSLEMPVAQIQHAGPGAEALPYPISDDTEPLATVPESVPASTSTSTSGHCRGPVHELVRLAWTRVGLTTLKMGDKDNDCSMYDYVDGPAGRAGGGDLVTTLLLAREYQRHGHQVTMQQLIDNPTMQAQHKLIASCRGDSALSGIQGC